MVRKYTSKTAGKHITPEPFELDGVVFIPGEVSFLDFTELGRFSGADITSPEGTAAIGEFFRNLLGEDYERFRTHIRQHHTDEETLIQVLRDIVEDVSGHPSQRPSVSPTGPTKTGRTLRVVSLSEGTVVEEPLTEEREAELLAMAQMDEPESQAG